MKCQINFFFGGPKTNQIIKLISQNNIGYNLDRQILCSTYIISLVAICIQNERKGRLNLPKELKI